MGHHIPSTHTTRYLHTPNHEQLRSVFISGSQGHPSWNTVFVPWFHAGDLLLEGTRWLDSRGWGGDSGYIMVYYGKIVVIS